MGTIDDITDEGLIEGFSTYMFLRKKDCDGKHKRQIGEQVMAINAGFGASPE